MYMSNNDRKCLIEDIEKCTTEEQLDTLRKARVMPFITKVCEDAGLALVQVGTGYRFSLLNFSVIPEGHALFGAISGPDIIDLLEKLEKEHPYTSTSEICRQMNILRQVRHAIYLMDSALRTRLTIQLNALAGQQAGYASAVKQAEPVYTKQGLKITPTGWEDSKGNTWNNTTYTAEQASAASATLTGCRNCADCDHCKDCSGSRALTYCEDCHRCRACSFCHHCRDCWECGDCYEVSDCQSCRDCHGCSGLRGSNNRSNIHAERTNCKKVKSPRVVFSTDDWAVKYEDGYWVDKNRNKWDANIYTRVKAEELSYTLKECSDCWNCKDCTDCKDCRECTGCGNCTKCSQCVECSNCTACWSCSGCADCQECTKCNHGSSCNKCEVCSGCTGCNNCSSCTDCAGCTGCQECRDCRDCRHCTACYDTTACLCCKHCSKCIHLGGGEHEQSVDHSTDYKAVVLSDGRYVDGNGNSWDAATLSKEDAQRAAATLIKCIDCKDCFNCAYCIRCQNCRCCESCENCIGCANCEMCTVCRDCIARTNHTGRQHIEIDCETERISTSPSKLHRTTCGWGDDNGNVWWESLVTEKQANELAMTLTDCRDCTNCSHCTRCVRCVSCVYCDDCSGCAKCTECTSCGDCWSCTCCSSCVFCKMCYGCHSCTYLAEGKDSKDLHACPRCNRPKQCCCRHLNNNCNERK